MAEVEEQQRPHGPTPADQNPQALERQEDQQTSSARDRWKRANPRRKRTIRFVVLALIVVAVIVTIPIYAYYSVRESTDNAQVDTLTLIRERLVTLNVLVERHVARPYGGG